MNENSSRISIPESPCNYLPADCQLSIQKKCVIDPDVKSAELFIGILFFSSYFEKQRHTLKYDKEL